MKVLNVFAIILAWILSIAMVVMLVAAPITLSALSLLKPETIADIMGEALVGNNASAAAEPQEYSVENLSVDSNVREENSLAVSPMDENAASDDVLGGLMDGVQDIIGKEVDEEILNKILQSNAASELLDAYMGDVANAITGKPEENRFTAELLVEVVQNNIDEIVEIVEESGVTLSEEQKTQFKAEIEKAVEENAEDIVAELPDPEEIKEAIIESNEGLEIAFEILTEKNEIKGAIVGAIVVISLLIFGLRYPGFRGLRWLSANLFTAGGFNILICVVLGAGSTAVLGAAEGMNAIGGSQAAGVIGMLLSQFTTGVVVRTVIMFVAAIALLVAYILLKTFVRKKKTVKKVEPVAEEPVPAPAPVAPPAYSSVTIEPELIAEPAPEVAQESEEETPASEEEV